jgi:hypothetical protein
LTAQYDPNFIRLLSQLERPGLAGFNPHPFGTAKSAQQMVIMGLKRQ